MDSSLKKKKKKMWALKLLRGRRGPAREGLGLGRSSEVEVGFCWDWFFPFPRKRFAEAIEVLEVWSLPRELIQGLSILWDFVSVLEQLPWDERRPRESLGAWECEVWL